VKFGPDEFLAGSWILPPELLVPPAAHVEVIDGAWIHGDWPVTDAVAGMVQPWVTRTEHRGEPHLLQRSN
jgi:hypothetical protein